MSDPNRPRSRKRRRLLPGFPLTLGLTLTYLTLIVLIPLSTIFVKAGAVSRPEFLKILSDPEVISAFRLTFGASLAAATVNLVFGFIVAWVLSRYSFPGRRLVDGLVDLPFALPTAVAGIALTTILSKNGWVGRYLEPHGIKVAYAPAGVVIALIFIGIPFVVRTVQPVLDDLDSEIEEAAASLGASRLQTFARVILPLITPALLTGFALSFARAVGEYGSVVFISGNLPMKTEIVPQIIYGKLDQYDYPGAAAVAVVMLVASFVLLLGINGLQWWTARRLGGVKGT